MNSLMQRLSAESSNPILDQRLPVEKRAEEGWYIGSSDIDGQGVFAGRDYEAGESIGLAMTPGDEDEWSAKIWNLTTLARYCNHQANNNVQIQKEDGKFELVASKPISQDDELVASYYQVSRALGPHTRMMWDGKDVPASDNFDDYVEKEAAAKSELIHSCCKRPAGECPGCPAGMQLIQKRDDNEDS